MDGVLPVERIPQAEGAPALRPGDTVIVSVTGRDESGNYLLSAVRVERPRDWSAFERAFQEKLPIAGVVKEVVKGGLKVDCGVEAFLPASRSGVRDAAEMAKLVGQEIQCRIIKLEVVSEDADVVVDRRVLLEEEEAKNRELAFASLTEGSVVTGQVRSLTDFGAFVSLAPGVDGLLHVADIAWSRIRKPEDVLKIGDPVEVKILRINPETRKISVGRKQLLPDPWMVAAETFSPGQRVKGTVSRLTDFGAFVELLPGVDGLIHVSELSWTKKIRKPSDLLKAGEQVEVVVLGVKIAEKRISLGLKQALGDPWEEAEKKFASGTVIEGPVTSLTSFGAFVDIGNGLEGMVHIADITNEKRLNHPREMLAVGQTVKATVLGVDREKRRIRLGMKQLEPTSADEFIAEHKTGDSITGRLVDVGANRAKVEVAEGVVAECKLTGRGKPAGSGSPSAETPKADLSSLTAMLSAKWKQGPSVSTDESSELKPGQVRSFRIVNLDPAKKKIEVDLVG
jgi:small subunit ribosomal protein S1